MSALIERLRAALGADYDVLEELASGGMGVVYKAKDRTLGRLVAIKVIRPDLATAAATERFLREARILASFSHPCIVPVHRAGEADGLAYYVMDFLDGETLAARLSRGALPTGDAAHIADNLLAALEAVHAHGIVHRDVKPSNIFLASGRAVLSDFGISKSSDAVTTTLTAPGAVVGTPGYMPPEQLAGGAVTARADVCAAAMVIFEAYTGRQWTFDSHTDKSDWNGVPAGATPALRRALAWSPDRRFADAGELRNALSSRSGSAGRWLTRIAAAALVVAAGVLIALRVTGSRGPGAPLVVDIQPFQVIGAGPAGLGDSLAFALTEALSGAQDITFRRAAWRFLRPPDVTVSGRVVVTRDSVRVELRSLGRRDGTAAATSAVAAAGAPSASVVDSLAPSLLLSVWTTYGRALGPDLARRALPRSTAGLLAWAKAEALYARAQWGAADSAYDRAVAVDPTCLLCALRLSLISRWMRRDQDTLVTARLMAGLDRFPAHYRRLIRADVASVDRWDSLEALVKSEPDFDLAQFILADELYHRGALAGHRRAEALPLLRNVVRLRPSFAPAWEHLAWVAAAEGDSVLAQTALETYARAAGAGDYVSLELQAVIAVGLEWRFMPLVAAQMTDSFLKDPRITGFRDFASGPRYLLSFDAPPGVVWLGDRFTTWPGRAELRGPGFVGQIVGLLALGRADSAMRVAARMAAASSDAEYALIAGEFDAAHAMYDSLDAAAAFQRTLATLAPVTREGAASMAQRRRAAWMLTLLGRRAGAVTTQWRAQLSDEPAPRPLGAFLDADSAAQTNPGRGLELSAPLLRLDSAAQAGDPFFRTALHMSRGRWRAQTGNLRPAVQELRWHENSDLVGLPGSLAQAVDVDWAFGTVGRWYRARLLEQLGQAGDNDEMCDAFAGVVRLWSHGDAVFAARARDASVALGRHRCPKAR